MSKKCSIVPQVWHNGKLNNSKAFSQLWENAKVVYSDPVIARNKAKADYYSMFQPDFKQANGDWELLYRLTNGLADSQDLSTFENVYNSNLQALKDSIKVELNDQGEPTSISKEQHSDMLLYGTNENAEYLNNGDQLVMSRVISKIIIESFLHSGVENLANLKVSDFYTQGSIKDAVIKGLEELYDKNKNENLKTVINYIINDEKDVWSRFVGYFSTKFNIRVKDMSSFEEEDSIDDIEKEVTSKLAEIPHNFDDSQLGIDLVKTVAAEIKFELAKATYGNFDLLKLETKEILTPGKRGKTPKLDIIEYYTGNVKKFDIEIPFDVDDIWNQILSINYGAVTKDQVIQSLEYLSDVFYNGNLSPFIDRLKDENSSFYNLFYRTAKLAIIDNVTLNVDKNVEKEGAAFYNIVTNNRASKAENVAYNKILSNMDGMIKFKNHNLAKIFDSLYEYKSSGKLANKVRNVITISENLGIPLRMYNIAFFLKLKGIYKGSVIDFEDYIKTATDIDTESYLKEIDEIKGNLETIAANIYKGYGITYGKIKKDSPDKLNFSELAKAKKDFKLSSEAKAVISKIANLTRVDVADLTSMSYYNSKFDREQSPQYNSFFSDFFNGLSSNYGTVLTPEQIKQKFNDYISDPRLDFDNFLWEGGVESHRGLFSPLWRDTVHGKKKYVSEKDGVNMSMLERLNVIQFSGNRYSSSGTGEGYKEIKDDNWNLTYALSAMFGYYLIPTSDSGRSYGIKRKFEHFETMIPENYFDEYGVLDIYNEEGKVYLPKEIKDTNLYSYIQNNLYQEFKDIQLTFDKLYDKDAYVKKDKLKVKPEYASKEGQLSLLRGIEIDYAEIEEDGRTSKKLVLVNKNKPTGRVFNLSNLVYIKDGKKITLKDYIQNPENNPNPENPFDYLREVLLLDLDSYLPSHFQKMMDNFIAEWLFYNQVETIESFDSIRDDIVLAGRSRGYEEVLETTEEGTKSEIKKNALVPVPVNRKDLSKEEIQEWSYNVTSLNLFLNNHFNTVIFGNLLFGNVTEFKDMTAWNKRVNQTIRNGSSTPSEESYTMAVMEDIELKSNMLDLMDNIPNVNKKDIEAFKERFKKEITTTNAIDVITDIELVKRLKSFGVYERYAKLIEDINNEDVVFNPKDYNYLIEQLKFFSYSRQLHGDRVVSVQNKNSTIVLFRRFTRGTEKRLLYKFMIDNGIDDINTSEGHKLSIIAPIKLHNEDGTFNRSLLDSKNVNIDKHTIKLYHKDLRIQLDVVPHLENKQNRLATQLLKKTLDNIISDHAYNLALAIGKEDKIKGRTGSYKYKDMGAYEMFHYILSYGAEESARELIADYGGLSEGEIKQSNEDMSIDIDVKKVAKIIEKYFLDNTIDLNILNAVKVGKDGMPNLPYHHPSLLKLIENVLEAKITNKVTHQKISGSHLPIQPDMFTNPIRPIQDAGNDKSHITYTKEFLAESKVRKSRKLRADGYVNGKYKPAEIVINPFDKRFYHPDFLMDDGSGRVDIDKIKAKDPKLLMVFGTRIPHEGDQSSFVGEIVGFIQDGASTAITPDHLVMRTGWDFDIDTVYLYHYAFDNNLKTYNMDDSSHLAYSRRLNNYIKRYYPEHYDANAIRIGYENYLLYQKLVDLEIETNEDIYDEILNVRDRTIAKNLSKKIQASIKRVEKLTADGISSDSEAILKEVDFQKREGIKLHKVLNFNPDQLFVRFKDNPSVQARILARDQRLAELQEEIQKQVTENKKETEAYTKFKKSKEQEFKALHKIKASTKAERNNRLIDLLIAFHGDETNFLDREKPNDIQHISRASKYVNKLTNYNVSNAHVTNISNQLYFRNLNMNIATLKENSVAYDNVLAVLNSVTAFNHLHPVSAVMTFEQIKGYDPKNIIESINKVVARNFGKPTNYNIDYENKKVYIKNIGFIGNNYNEDGTDIQGERIAEQRSELTANILDAVKELMINLNQDTFAIFAYLSSTPLSYYTNIHTGGEAEVNRYIYPALYVSQPIIQDISKLTVANNRFGDKRYSSYNTREVETEYLSNLLEKFIRTDNQETHDIEGFFFTLSKTFDLSEEQIAEMTLKNRRFDPESYIENKRQQYADALASIIEFKKSNKLMDFDISAVNDYLKNINLPIIESRPYTIEELSTNIEHGQHFKSAEYFIGQLSILKHYEEVDKASADVRSLMGILTTDKLGAGPTSATTNKLFNNIVRFETNFGEFESWLRRRFREDDNDGYRKTIKEINDNLHSLVSLPDKLSYIHGVYQEYDYEDRLSPIVTYKKGKTTKSITSAIYGDLFRTNTPDYLNSEYPYLASQAIWTNLLSTKLYNNIILSEKPKVKAVLNKTLANMDSINDEKIRYRLLMYLMNKNVSQLSFLNKADYSKVLSIPTVTFNSETKRVERKLPDYMNAEDFAFFADISTFKNLTLDNQIELLHRIGTNTSFLRFINIKSDADSLEQNGYVAITTPDSDSSINEARDMFKQMYNSRNAYDREVAQNIIRYAFITNGFQFGSSISKYIPTDIFFNPEETTETKNDLYKVRSILYDEDNVSTDLTPYDIENIHKSNWNNSNINPTMQLTSYYRNGQRKINYDRPTWNSKASTNKNVHSEVDSPLLSHIIVESASKVNDSKYANKDYLIKEVNIRDKVSKTLYKRYHSAIGDHYFYYPINKTLSFEYGKSIVPDNNKIILPTGVEDIADQKQYIDLIEGFTVKNNAKQRFAKEVKEIAPYSQVLREIASTSDVVVFVGNKGSHEANIVSNLIGKDKSIILSEREFISRGAVLSNKGFKSKSVTLIGNNSLTESTSDMNAAILKFIERNDISKITTLFSKESTNESIQGILVQSTAITTPVEYTSDEQHANNLFEVEYSASTADTLLVSMMNEIKREEGNILTIATRLQNHLSHTSAKDIKTLENIVKDAKKIINNLDPIQPSLDAISDIITTNTILFDFLNYHIDNLKSDLLLADIEKFTKSEHHDEMVDYANKLENFYNFILAAQNVINLPIYAEEDIARLNEEDQDVVSSYNNAALVLKANQTVIDSLKDFANTLVKRYHSIDVISRSRNPEYIESLYQHAIRTMREEGVSADQIPNLKITEEDLSRVIHRMLNNNEDISWYAARLDSRRDTFVTLVDILGKFYAESLFRSNIDASNKVNKVKTMLSKVYSNTNKEFDSAREQWFMNKFLTPTGDLISEYDMSQYREKVGALSQQRSILIEKRRNLRRSKNKEGLGLVNSEIEKITRLLKTLVTKEEIKIGSEEYNRHFDAWFSLSTTQQRNYERNNSIRFVNGNTFRIYRLIPSEEFASKEFKKLTQDEKDFLFELKAFMNNAVHDVFSANELNQSFIPYGFKPTIKGEVKRLFGISKKNKESFYVNLHNENQYYLDAPMLHPIKIKDLIKLPSEINSKNRDSVLDEINKDREESEKFKSIDEVYKYNKEVSNAAKLAIKDVRNFDIGNLLHEFVDQLAKIKTVKDFEATYRLTLITLGSDEFKASVKKGNGKDIIDNIKSAILNQHETIKLIGKNTRIYTSTRDWAKAIYNVPRSTTNTDVILNAVLRFTSMGTMMFNMRAGVKNVIAGYTYMVTEAFANEFINKSELASATNQYRKSFVSLMKSIGKETTDDLHVGLMKYFGMLFEDHTEGHTDTTTTTIGKALKAWDNVGYMALNSGEHFMQFSILLAMLKSHRMVDKFAMSLSDYINDRRMKALESVLSASDYSELFQYVYKNKSKEQNATNYVDHVGNWLTDKHSDFSDELKSEIRDKIKELEKIATEEFYKLETVESQFELVDGIIKIKEGSQLESRFAAEFADRVRKVNHSLQGIYNTIDRAAIQDNLIGELFMQFRKWMRPTFGRWFGYKFAKTSFSEATGTYRSGAYVDFWKFISMPITRGLKESKENNLPLLEAMSNIARGYIEFLRNASYYYTKLPMHQRANINRSLTSIFSMTMATILLSITYAIGGDDDKKYKNALAANAIYQLSAIQTELFETTPFGWATFYFRSKRNIMASERALTDLAALVYYTMLYPFQSDDQRVYQRGIYKDESKLEVYLKKSLPLYRQIQTQQHLPNTISYYQMYNPILNLVGSK